jgi:hypothetical protein
MDTIGSPFWLYIRLFADAMNIDYSLFKRRFTDLHIKEFNVRISNWKTTNGWSNKEVCGLIYYCYLHNPLASVDLKLYGQADNIGKCVSTYAKWLRANQERIEKDGLLKAIFSTSPNTTYSELSRAMSLDEVHEIYGKH